MLNLVVYKVNTGAYRVKIYSTYYNIQDISSSYHTV